MAGCTVIPCRLDPIVRSRQEELVDLHIDNDGQERLNPIDRALSFQNMIDAGMDVDNIALKFSKRPQDIKNDLSLLKFSDAIREHIANGAIKKRSRCLY